MCPLVTNIQKYSIHDGPGIRTTVFFKGCPLRCRWCHNPENLSYENELWDDGREVGRKADIDEIVKEVLKDRIFYEESGGGVTLSGGEVLSLEEAFLKELVNRFWEEDIQIIIDTCGAVPYERFEAVRDRTAAFLFDIKLMDSALHRKYTGRDNGEILENLKRLSADGAALYIRVPMIRGLSATDENINAMTAFLRDNRINLRELRLLPYHDTGSGKYGRLGKSYEGEELKAPSEDEMERYAGLIREAGFINVVTG